jgi:hypothetical protein
VREEDGPPGPGHHLRRLHVTLLPLDECAHPRRAGEGHPLGERDGADHHRDTEGLVRRTGEHAPRHAVEQHRHQDRREGQLGVGGAHQERVEPAAAVPAHQTGGEPEEHRQGHRREADAHREPEPEEDAGEDVAALLVGPERELAVALRLPPGGARRS